MKIRYSHINRESVLPLGKDMVQIPPIPPRFIDTIFSIGYIVYNVRTGEQLTRRRQNAKGFEELLDCAGVLFLENNQTGNLIINPPLSSIDDLMKYMQIDFLQPQSPSSAVRTDLWFYLHHSSWHRSCLSLYHYMVLYTQNATAVLCCCGICFTLLLCV